MWGCFCSILFRNISDGERFPCDRLKKVSSLFLTVEFTFCGTEYSITVRSCENPIGFRFEIINLLLSVHDESESWCLYTAYRENLTVLSVFERIKAGRIHSQKPVADSTA